MFRTDADAAHVAVLFMSCLRSTGCCSSGCTLSSAGPGSDAAAARPCWRLEQPQLCARTTVARECRGLIAPSCCAGRHNTYSCCVCHMCRLEVDTAAAGGGRKLLAHGNGHNEGSIDHTELRSEKISDTALGSQQAILKSFDKGG